MFEIRIRHQISDQPIWIESTESFEELSRNEKAYIFRMMKEKDFEIDENNVDNDPEFRGSILIAKEHGLDLSYIFNVIKVSSKWITVQYEGIIG